MRRRRRHSNHLACEATNQLSKVLTIVVLAMGSMEGGMPTGAVQAAFSIFRMYVYRCCFWFVFGCIRIAEIVLAWWMPGITKLIQALSKGVPH